MERPRRLISATDSEDWFSLMGPTSLLALAIATADARGIAGFAGGSDVIEAALETLPPDFGTSLGAAVSSRARRLLGSSCIENCTSTVSVRTGPCGREPWFNCLFISRPFLVMFITGRCFDNSHRKSATTSCLEAFGGTPFRMYSTPNGVALNAQHLGDTSSGGWRQSEALNPTSVYGVRVRHGYFFNVIDVEAWFTPQVQLAWEEMDRTQPPGRRLSAAAGDTNSTGGAPPSVTTAPPAHDHYRISSAHNRPCTLDFMGLGDGGDHVFEPDGNLVAEFIALERLWRAGCGSFACAVSSAPQLECIDLAGPTTLAATSIGTTAQRLVDSSDPETRHFHAASRSHTTSYHRPRFGVKRDCGDSEQGECLPSNDGAIGAYDVAAMLWYILAEPPYDTLQQVPAQVKTVMPGEVAARCAGSADSAPREDDVSARAVWAMQHYNRSADELSDMTATVNTWSQAKSGGWVKVALSGVQTVYELLLIGLSHDPQREVELSGEAFPDQDCGEECAPDLPEQIQIRFARRMEYAHRSSLAAVSEADSLSWAVTLASDACATINGNFGGGVAMRGSTLSLRQDPPTKACSFDVFVWVPQQSAPARLRLAAGSSSQGTTPSLLRMDVSSAHLLPSPSTLLSTPPAPQIPHFVGIGVLGLIMVALFILVIRCNFLWRLTDHERSRTSWMERALGGSPKLVRVGSRASLCEMRTATSIENLPLHTVRLATSAKIPVPQTPTPSTPAVQTTRYAETPPPLPPPPPTPTPPTPTPTTPAVQTTRSAETPPPPPPPPPPNPPTLQTTPLLGAPGLPSPPSRVLQQVANSRGPSPSRFVRRAVARGRARSRSAMLPITASWVVDDRDLGPRPARRPEVAPAASGWTSDVRLAEVHDDSKSLRGAG